MLLHKLHHASQTKLLRLVRQEFGRVVEPAETHPTLFERLSAIGAIELAGLTPAEAIERALSFLDRPVASYQAAKAGMVTKDTAWEGDRFVEQSDKLVAE